MAEPIEEKKEETEAERDQRLGQITLPRSGEPGSPDYVRPVVGKKKARK